MTLDLTCWWCKGCLFSYANNSSDRIQTYVISFSSDTNCQNKVGCNICNVTVRAQIVSDVLNSAHPLRPLWFGGWLHHELINKHATNRCPLVWDCLVCNPEHLLPGFSLKLYSSAGRAQPRVLQGESDFLKRFHAASRVWEILLCDGSWLGLGWGGGLEEENWTLWNMEHTAVSGQSPTVVPRQPANLLTYLPPRPDGTHPWRCYIWWNQTAE